MKVTQNQAIFGGALGLIMILISMFGPKFDNAQMLSSAVKLLCEHPVGDTRRTISVEGSGFFVNKSTIVTNEHVSPINSDVVQLLQQMISLIFFQLKFLGQKQKLIWQFLSLKMK